MVNVYVKDMLSFVILTFKFKMYVSHFVLVKSYNFVSYKQGVGAISISNAEKSSPDGDTLPHEEHLEFGELHLSSSESDYSDAEGSHPRHLMDCYSKVRSMALFCFVLLAKVGRSLKIK